MFRGPKMRKIVSLWSGHLVLLGILAVMLFPYYGMISTSLKAFDEVYLSPPTWLPKIPRFENYVDIWKYTDLSAYLRNSLYVMVGTTVLSLLTAMPAAYAISRLRFRGRLLFLYMSLSLQMFGPEMVIVGLFSTMYKYGLINTYTSLILANTAFNLPLAIWLLQGYLRGIPEEIDQAAMIDGCSRFQTLRYIITPIAKPGIVVVTIMTAINTWNEFLCALTFISSPAKRLITVGLFSFVGLWEIKWNYLMAGALVSTVPMVVLFAFIMKYMAKGLVIGAYR